VRCVPLGLLGDIGAPACADTQTGRSRSQEPGRGFVASSAAPAPLPPPRYAVRSGRGPGRRRPGGSLGAARRSRPWRDTITPRREWGARECPGAVSGEDDIRQVRDAFRNRHREENFPLTTNKRPGPPLRPPISQDAVGGRGAGIDSRRTQLSVVCPDADRARPEGKSR
jgi:hypothetical protein